jgi:aminoacrylate hydrolase
VSVDVYDKPGAETVVLSAGLGGAAGYWMPQLAALKERYRVVAYDQDGTGRLKANQLPQGYAIADMTRQVVEAMDASGTASCHFVGHALGGLVGVDLALRAPERVKSLTIINGWAKADAHTRRCFEARVKLLHGAGPEAYARAQPIFLYPAQWLAANEARMVQEDHHAIAGFQGTNNLLRRIEALLAFDATARVSELRMPVFLVASRDDVLVPCSQSETLARALPNAALKMFEWGAHGVNVTVPEAFNEALLKFLASPVRRGREAMS